MEYKFTQFYATYIKRNLSYGPATRQWRLKKIVNPQGTDSLVFTHKQVSRNKWARTDNVYSANCMTYSAGAGKFPSFKPDISTGFPSTTGQYYYSTLGVPVKVSGKRGSIEFTGYPCTRLRLLDPSGKEVKRVGISYNLIKNRNDESRNVLTGYTVSSGDVMLDRATFEYRNPVGRVYSTDLFGYSNGNETPAYRSVLSAVEKKISEDDKKDTPKFKFEDIWDDQKEDFKPGHTLPLQKDFKVDMDAMSRGETNTHVLTVALARRPRPEWVAYALEKVETLAGGCTKLEYEGNTVPKGWVVTRDTLDLTIGLRLKRETVTDAVTGSVRVREFTYEEPMSTIDFRRVGLAPFLSVGGVLTINNGGDETRSTGVSFLASSRLPGAALENTEIYYGKVSERVTGTGIPDTLLTVYEHDMENVRLFTTTTKGRAQTGNSRFCGTFTTGPNYTPECMMAAFAPMPIGAYYMERIGDKARISRKTEYTAGGPAKRRPARVTRYKYNSRNVTASYITGYYVESLVRQTNRFGVGILGEKFESVDDFERIQVNLSYSKSRLDSVITTEYADDGSSRTVGKRYVYNDRLPNMILIPLEDGKYRMYEEFKKSRIPNGLLRFESASCGPDTISTEHFYSADATSGMLYEIAVNGWYSLPFKTVTRLNSDTVTVENEYGGDMRLVMETGRLSVAEPFFSTKIVWAECGRPSVVTKNEDFPTFYSWSDNGADLLSVTDGNSLKTNYTHIPLVGVKTIKLPSGKATEFAYTGTRLSSERVNGTIVKTYTYGLYGAPGDGFEGNCAAVTVADGKEGVSAYTFFDASGREVASASGSGGSYVVSATEYDALGRKTRVFRPFGTDWLTAMPEARDLALGAQYPGDTAPFSALGYGISPDDKPLTVTIPGKEHAAHPAKVTYAFNRKSPSPSEKWKACARYLARPDGSLTLAGNHDDGTLEIARTVDGDGRASYTYTDFRGRLILERRELSAGQYSDTYHVYDNMDNLVYVLTPLASEKLRDTGKSWTVSGSDALADHAYAYTYDRRFRMLSRKAPGCAPVRYLYDSTGLPVMSQDGEQRRRGVWRFDIPDRGGRPAVSGECSATADLEESVASNRVRATYGSPVTTAMAGYGVNIRLEGVRLDLASYYDGYGFTDRPEFEAIKGKPGCPPRSHSEGLLTGTLARVLDDDSAATSYIATINSYDARDRLTGSISSSIDGGYDVSLTSYDNADRPVTSTWRAYGPDGTLLNTHTEKTEYDGFGRMKSLKSTGADSGKLLAESNMAYDGAGNLVSETRGAALRLAYGHFTDGSLKSIGKNGSDYITLSRGSLHSGLISGITWRGADGVTRGYDYAYDGMSRLTLASYRESGRTGCGDYTASYTYDLNSNPLTIKRNGLTDAVSASGSTRLEFGEVDNLSLTYSGARPLRVSEAADDTPYSGSSDYPAGKNSGKDMAYDLDGRLVSDPSRSVDSVLYNSIGLPREIKVRGGSGVKRLYSADGRLLRTVVRDTGMEIYEGTLPGSGKPTRPGTSAGLGTLPWDFGSGSGQGVTVDIGTRDTTDYRGPLRYLNGSLDRRITPSGYVKADTAYYFVTDHQGNVRQVVRGADGRVVQEAHYYPYGGLFGESSATALEAVNGIGENDRLFGGKERTALSDLQFLDFEARLYDPQLGMFWTADPMMEDYYPYSYRLYCMANPVNLVDPTGMNATILRDKDCTTGHVAMLIEGEDGKLLYYSVNGEGKEVSGIFSGGCETNDIGVEGNWSTPEEFLNSSDRQEINGDAEKTDNLNHFEYSEAYVIETTPEQDKVMRQTFSEIAKTKYNLITNNCATTVTRTLMSAGININFTRTLPSSPQFGGLTVVSGGLNTIRPVDVFNCIVGSTKGRLITKQK